MNPSEIVRIVVAVGGMMLGAVGGAYGAHIATRERLTTCETKVEALSETIDQRLQRLESQVDDIHKVLIERKR